MEKQEQATVVETAPTAPFVNEECGDTMWDAVLQQEQESLTHVVWCNPGIIKE